ncbi:MAG: PepSY domain-containing protein [Chitinophaga sp.]|uniref:PepSY-associated TM helix domain-containing protein n=1 Tax=Chitinophaga sp. TaxID=1869181 RepID=UPI0025B9DFBE|nr:PepSY-associated TM helix domain-containing protein [Chitinophaga sp.]MBV8253578.1 PepSY domain-containing protein [Chitinophaga sp.]
MKIFFRRIHLYLGLAAGLIITISCLTGAMLVFENDITQALNHDRYFVTPVGQRLPLDTLAARVQQVVPKAKIARIQVFADPERTVQILFEEGKKKEGKEAREAKAEKPQAAKGDKPGKEAPKKKEKGRTAFVNPYTGQVIELYSYQATFYYKIFSLHRWLLSGDTGKVIIGTSTFIFLFILITGIILWIPKTKNILQQRLKIKWDGNWKRVNNDLHVVLGFYTSIFLFIIAFTGLTWSFQWFSDAFYAPLGGTKPAEMPKSAPVVADASKVISFESAVQAVQQTDPTALFYSVATPKDSAGTFVVNALPKNASTEVATTTYYVDQHAGNIVSSQTFAARQINQKVKSLIKPIHTGAIYGTPTKILWLMIALMGAIFPTTGTLMWINRTRKKKKKAPAKVELQENVVG